MEMVGDPQRLEASGLGHLRLLEKIVRSKLLARQEIPELCHVSLLSFDGEPAVPPAARPPPAVLLFLDRNERTHLGSVPGPDPPVTAHLPARPKMARKVQAICFEHVARCGLPDARGARPTVKDETGRKLDTANIHPVDFSGELGKAEGYELDLVVGSCSVLDAWFPGQREASKEHYKNR